MMFYSGVAKNENVMSMVKMFIPLPLMYIMNIVMKMFENPDVATDHAFFQYQYHVQTSLTSC